MHFTTGIVVRIKLDEQRENYTNIKLKKYIFFQLFS
ncbi:uncharacterized protein METZ01_LOCUS274216 [marine metagenome]|uniref:Uncharacterized protein n=1 Tax=marine metagenome TaxID=408172 RepID=A0A382KDC5_9ZZZZ